METEVNKEYASKGIAGTGLGLGIAGTALGLLAGGFNGGAFGPFMGGRAAMAANDIGVSVLAEKDAKIARLESEKYTDGKVQELFSHSYSENKELMQFLSGVDKRIAQLETAAPLREQVMEGKIAQVAQQANCCCTALNAQITALQTTLASITKTVVPNTSVCPGWGNVTITTAAS